MAVRVEDGEERLLLETSELRSATFSWSPDGRELLIPANEDGQSRLLKYSVVTGEYTVLPTDHEVLIRAVWSPDGKRAALIAEIPGTTRIRLWILDTASGDTQPVDHRRGGPVAITWSGRYMIYSYLVTTPGNEEEFNGLPTLMRWDRGSGERTTIAAPGSLALNTISAPNCIIW